MQEQVHAMLFPSVRLLDVSEQSARRRNLNVVVNLLETNAHNSSFHFAFASNILNVSIVDVS
jgi:hypothetical protein